MSCVTVYYSNFFSFYLGQPHGQLVFLQGTLAIYAILCERDKAREQCEKLDEARSNGQQQLPARYHWE